MRKQLILIVALLAALGASAETGAPAEMRKLDWMIGDWRGDAMAVTREGRQLVVQHETITSDLGGAILVIRGRGYAKKEDGTQGALVHDALGVISWDPDKKDYRFDPWAKGGRHADTTFVVGDRTFTWSIAVPGGTIRYVMRLTDTGQWHEAGEFLREGAAPIKTFEMTLTKVK